MVPNEFFGNEIDGLLGANFLDKNGADIYFEENKMLFKKSQKPIP